METPSLINKITSTIAHQTEMCSYDSEVRNYLCEKSAIEEDLNIKNRYTICSQCEFLAENFKILGVTILEKTPQCSQCGCNLNLKIPMEIFNCPLVKW